ncbi:MAG: hypothetical protein ABIL58_12380 [Pseudomonadota bacterium]
MIDLKQLELAVAMDGIAEILSGTEWDSDTACKVAELVRLTGRDVDELD